jgi:hypothetical protein
MEIIKYFKLVLLNRRNNNIEILIILGFKMIERN